MRLGLCCIILARRCALSVSTSDSCTDRLVGERRIMLVSAGDARIWQDGDRVRVTVTVEVTSHEC